MQRRAINAAEAPPAIGYARAVEVSGARRTLHVSGQIPVDAEGRCPDSFDAQCRLAWRNVIAQLTAADMSLADLVKVTIYLADRRYGLANRAIRKEMLGEHLVASTVIVTGIFDESWLVEIEAVAVA
ncbi:RidA family protein [Phreatobacter sp. AB_2022a]|uniref:RidA family protein n=1 Tax=Phreatobacter sp. AB_2022a TaxID=3003134 RepID=UPI00228706B5|nr:RidA family protein [Phreatobacter sp. AB_2022a]MCZ0737086.1 RidA family protein [Phreatobacter sp. AB_2022a]